MTDLEACLAEAASLFEELSIPYLLIGGPTVAAWGEARATLDDDISVWTEPPHFEPAVQDLC